MRHILVLLLGLLIPSVATAGCDPRYYVCDNPSYSQVVERAKSIPVVTGKRRQLGVDWATTHENIMNKRSYTQWSCTKTMLYTNTGNVNIALCMPLWMRRVPPETKLQFVFQEDATRRIPLRRALYVVTEASQAENLRYQFR